MKKSILFNVSLRKEVEKKAADFTSIKQTIFLSVIISFILLVFFYFFCLYFTPDPAFSFSFCFIWILYLAAHITKFVVLDFIVRPKLMKEKDKLTI